MRKKFQNDPFHLQIRIIGLTEWKCKGISDLTDLLISLKSLEQIRKDFDIPSNDFHKYLQICHFGVSPLRENKFHLILSELENATVSATSLEGKISEFYDILLHPDTSAADSEATLGA